MRKFNNFCIRQYQRQASIWSRQDPLGKVRNYHWFGGFLEEPGHEEGDPDQREHRQQHSDRPEHYYFVSPLLNY